MTQEQTTLILNTVPNKVARECILKKGLYHKKGVSFKKKKFYAKFAVFCYFGSNLCHIHHIPRLTTICCSLPFEQIASSIQMKIFC